MPTADSGDIDRAVLALLNGDATLKGLMPDGVWLDVAPAGCKKFVLLSLEVHSDEPLYGDVNIEDNLYIVQAVAMVGLTPAANTKGAAKRIYDLLNDNTTLTAPGFALVGSARESRINEVEPDDRDPDIRFEHRGGRYRVQFQTTT